MRRQTLSKSSLWICIRSAWNTHWDFLIIVIIVIGAPTASFHAAATVDAHEIVQYWQWRNQWICIMVNIYSTICERAPSPSFSNVLLFTNCINWLNPIWTNSRWNSHSCQCRRRSKWFLWCLFCVSHWMPLISLLFNLIFVWIEYYSLQWQWMNENSSENRNFRMEDWWLCVCLR